MAEILTPRCPLCGGPPLVLFPSDTQVFCDNDDCILILWNPSATLDANLLDAGMVKFPPPEGDADD